MLLVILLTLGGYDDDGFRPLLRFVMMCSPKADLCLRVCGEFKRGSIRKPQRSSLLKTMTIANTFLFVRTVLISKSPFPVRVCLRQEEPSTPDDFVSENGVIVSTQIITHCNYSGKSHTAPEMIDQALNYYARRLRPV